MAELWEHVKSKRRYVVFTEARLEASMGPCSGGEGEMLVIYMSVADCGYWARPKDEFYDGRFRKIG